MLEVLSTPAGRGYVTMTTSSLLRRVDGRGDRVHRSHRRCLWWPCCHVMTFDGTACVRLSTDCLLTRGASRPLRCRTAGMGRAGPSVGRRSHGSWVGASSGVMARACSCSYGDHAAARLAAASHPMLDLPPECGGLSWERLFGQSSMQGDCVVSLVVSEGRGPWSWLWGEGGARDSREGKRVVLPRDRYYCGLELPPRPGGTGVKARREGRDEDAAGPARPADWRRGRNEGAQPLPRPTG
jgi:hypothetical protein